MFSIGIVGDGRVARHFRHYFSLLGIPTEQWSRGFEQPAEVALHSASTVLLLISDPAIEPVCRELRTKLPLAKNWIHFSASLSTDVAVGCHPLMTFGRELYDRESYEKICFVGEKGRLDEKAFRSLFPSFSKNRYFEIEPALKSRYHALCVLAGNFTSFLWAKLFTEFPKLGLPAEVALPYLEQISSNLSGHPNDPRKVLTGPIVRGDVQAIEKHLLALGEDPYRKIYEAFVSAEKGKTS